MPTKQLNNEYSKTMQEAAKAYGRRETMELYKKARSIRKTIYEVEPESPLLHNG